MPPRLAVLASGRGSNLRALFEYFRARPRSAKIALVLSDRPDAGALTFAQEHDIRAGVLDMGTGHSVGLTMMLEDAEIDLVVLAGYLKLVPSGVVRAYRGRIINVHPALLPAFGGRGMYGEHVHKAVLAAGARVTGVTVHFVDERYDRGPIVAQWPVPVFGDDTPQTLAARVLRVEHLLYPRAVEAVATRRVTVDRDGHVHGGARASLGHAAFALASRDDEELARDLAESLGHT